MAEASSLWSMEPLPSASNSLSNDDASVSEPACDRALLSSLSVMLPSPSLSRLLNICSAMSPSGGGGGCMALISVSDSSPSPSLSSEVKRSSLLLSWADNRLVPVSEEKRLAKELNSLLLMEPLPSVSADVKSCSDMEESLEDDEVVAEVALPPLARDSICSNCDAALPDDDRLEIMAGCLFRWGLSSPWAGHGCYGFHRRTGQGFFSQERRTAAVAAAVREKHHAATSLMLASRAPRVPLDRLPDMAALSLPAASRSLSETTPSLLVSSAS